MALWLVETTEHKSLIERNVYVKDGNTFIVEIGWRSGDFFVETEGDEPPVLAAGVDIYNCDYDADLGDTYDNCWEDYNDEGCDAETQQWLDDFFNEGNSYHELEEHGWTVEDSSMFINCVPAITRVEE